MATLNSCSPFFIRCIKPNEFKKAMVYILKQKQLFSLIIILRHFWKKRNYAINFNLIFDEIRFFE